MFPMMRKALGIDTSTDILDHIDTLSTHEQRLQAHRTIENIELEVMKEMVRYFY
jgi:hypothetical protein